MAHMELAITSGGPELLLDFITGRYVEWKSCAPGAEITGANITELQIVWICKYLKQFNTLVMNHLEKGFVDIDKT